MRRKTGIVAAGIAIAIVCAISAIALASDWYDAFDSLDDAGAYTLLQDVDHHFYLAKEAFKEKNYDDAANHIRTAAMYLKIEETRSKGQEHAALSEATNDLWTLANDVENKNVSSVKTLLDAFSRAQFAISMNSQIRAMDAWNAKDFEKAKLSLKASQTHLAHAIEWSKQKSMAEEKAGKNAGAGTGSSKAAK